MQLTYSIKNFRVFDAKGSTFNLKPITILTGANSSGKSSLVKSILLFKKYLDSCIDQPNLDPEKYRLSFSDKDVNINGINSVLNWNAGDNHDIVFSITLPHEPSNVHFSIEYTFSSRQSDILNDGWLKRLSCYCSIEDNKELFLDVSYDDDGKMSIETLNLSGNIYMSFIRDLELVSYARYFSPHQARQFFSLSKEEILHIEQQLNSLEETIVSNPLNRGIELSPNRLSINTIFNRFHNINRKIKEFPDLNIIGVSYNCLMKYKQNGLLLSIPILEDIGNMKSPELEDYLRHISIDDKYLNRGDSFIEGVENKHRRKELFTMMVQMVIEDFKHSNHHTFIDYYKEKEKVFLANIVMQSMRNHSDSDKNKNTNQSLDYNEGLVNKLESIMSMASNLYRLEYYQISGKVKRANYKSWEVTFAIIYNVLTYIQRKDLHTRTTQDNNTNEQFYKEVRDIKWVHHTMIQEIPESVVFIEFKSYVMSTVDKLLKNSSFSCVKHIESFLCPIQRSYSKYESNNTLSSILTEYIIESERLRLSYEAYKCGSFMNKWIKLLGIGSSASIKMSDDSTSYRLFIRSARKKAISSADMGHGITQLLSILLNIEVQIIRQAIRGNDKERCTLCFEEPEVSLHPSWQSKLAEIFFDAYKSYGIEFIIETHSEYMLRKSQVMVNKMNFANENELLLKNPFSVYYFDNQGKNKHCYEMVYRVDGKFTNQFGPGFFDESTNLLFEIL